MSTNKEKRANLSLLLKELKKELNDYVKAKRAEYRKKPVYLQKDSDIAVDKLRNAFNQFVSETYRD
jgi:uncharacterized protein VirK/YbjX